MSTSRRGVGYVWQKNQIYDLGQQIRKREHELADLQTQNDKLRRQLAWLGSPPNLEARIKELNLGLVQPQPSKIWRLKEPMPEPARPEAPPQGAPHLAQAIAAR